MKRIKTITDEAGRILRAECVGFWIYLDLHIKNGSAWDVYVLALTTEEADALAALTREPYAAPTDVPS